MKKNYTVFLIIILITIMFSDYFAQNYCKQIQSPAKQSLLNIFFADSLNGWAAGDSGWVSLGFTQTFIYSIDSGYTWKEIPTPNNSEIYDIKFIDSTKGYAVGKDGVILKYEYEPNSVVNDLMIQPQSFYLYQNYPNPFNPVTIISWQLAVMYRLRFMMFWEMK